MQIVEQLVGQTSPHSGARSLVETYKLNLDG